jgi:hypothetical protein
MRTQETTARDLARMIEDELGVAGLSVVIVSDRTVGWREEDNG